MHPNSRRICARDSGYLRRPSGSRRQQALWLHDCRCIRLRQSSYAHPFSVRREPAPCPYLWRKSPWPLMPESRHSQCRRSCRIHTVLTQQGCVN